MDAYVRKAALAALRSNHKNHMHGCVIINNRDGKIVATGYNHNSGAPLKESFSVHAEMHALSKLSSSMRSKYPDCSLLVIRVTNRCNPCAKHSFPCELCRKVIQKHKCIRKVYYSVA
jgi:deoxycytidylate deaminase